METCQPLTPLVLLPAGNDIVTIGNERKVAHGIAVIRSHSKNSQAPSRFTQLIIVVSMTPCSQYLAFFMTSFRGI